MTSPVRMYGPLYRCRLVLELDDSERKALSAHDLRILDAEHLYHRLEWIPEGQELKDNHCLFELCLTFVDVPNKFFISFGHPVKSMALTMPMNIMFKSGNVSKEVYLVSAITEAIVQLLKTQCNYNCTQKDFQYLLGRLIRKDFGIFQSQAQNDSERPILQLHMYLPTRYVISPKKSYHPYFIQDWEALGHEVKESFDKLSQVVVLPLIERFTEA